MFSQKSSQDIDMAGTVKAKLSTAMLDPTNPYNDRLLGFGRNMLKESTSIFNANILKGQMIGKHAE
ncbi:hypothetical protein ACO0KY_19710, partial [Undibacterium sp. Dicai25W]|uniref:hypothetical protein n=1 Tax=Undibacterium sp. Dicai25W TaxID=3413034 RepID=UPI003BF41E98